MRSYHGWWARFNEPDPWDGSYDLTDPQSFNRYAYVRNDPVNYVDPDGLQPDPLQEGISVAREALKHLSCRRLFGATDPERLLDEMLRKGRIQVGDSYPVSIIKETGQVARRQKFDSASVAAMTSRFLISKSSQIAWITLNREGFYFSGRVAGGAEINTVWPYNGLSMREIRGIVLIHELLHVAGAIGSDQGGVVGSLAHSFLVRLFCFDFPNRQLEIPPARLGTELSGGGDLGSGSSSGGGGGYPSWWYALWEFVAWIQSIRVEKVEVRVIEE
jgi:hypothetical protein